jgi:hypothetical protein
MIYRNFSPYYYEFAIHYKVEIRFGNYWLLLYLPSPIKVQRNNLSCRIDERHKFMSYYINIRNKLKQSSHVRSNSS